MGCITSCLSSTYYYFRENFFYHKDDYDNYDEGTSLISQENEENNRSIMLNVIKKEDKHIIIQVDDEIEQEDNNNLIATNNSINSFSFNKTIHSISGSSKGDDSHSHSHSRSNKSKSHSKDDTSTETYPESQDKIHEKYKCDGCDNYMLGKDKVIINEVGEIKQIILCKYCNVLYNMNRNENNDIEEDALPPNTPLLIYDNNINLERNNNNNNNNNDYDDLENIVNNDVIDIPEKIEEEDDDDENDNDDKEVGGIFPSKRKRSEESEKSDVSKDENMLVSKKKRNDGINNHRKIIITVDDEKLNILSDYEDPKYIFEKLCDIRFECSKCKNIYSSVDLFKDIDNNWVCINCRKIDYIGYIFDWTFKSKCGMIECNECGNSRDGWKFYSKTKNGKTKSGTTTTCLHCRNLKRKVIEINNNECINLDGSEMVRCCYKEHDCRIIDCVKYEEKYICKDCIKFFRVDYKQLKPIIGETRDGKLCNGCKKTFPNWYFEGKKTCNYCRIRQNNRNSIKRSQNKENEN